jgi:cbb3-type cytochrome oxidase subunit 3
MDNTFYTQDVYTATLIAVFAVALVFLGAIVLAFRAGRQDRYVGRHIARLELAPATSMARLELPSPEIAVDRYAATLPVPYRANHQRLILPASTRQPVTFPQTDSALEVFRRNMDSIIAGDYAHLIAA